MAAAYLMIPALVGHGHFAVRVDTVREQIVIVQLFIAVIGLSVVLVGAALAERRKLERGLASAIVRAEDAREEAYVARDSAERANRLKSMFLANMSHELRTPLNAIIGFSELMQSELYGALGDPRYREYSGLIQGAGHHLLSLISDILDMSKIEAGKFELHRQHFDIREIVHDCMDLMRERAQQDGVKLVEDLPARPPAIDADRRAVKQILLNLLSNAIKFTRSRTAARIEIGSSNGEGQPTFFVRDNGVGFDMRYADKLFRVFQRLHRVEDYEGTGVGLAIVQRIVVRHGGRIWAESVLEQGTTFYFTLSGDTPSG
jgi:signal transduction histidine kinase